MGGGDSAVGLVERPTPEAEAALRLEQSVPVGPDAGIMAILSTTRAMRYLAPDPVPDELIRSVIEAATWAPSMANLQLAAFVVVTDRETMARLAVVWRRVIEDFDLLTEAFAPSVPSDSSTKRTRESVEYQRDHFADTPALIIVCEVPGAIRATRGTFGGFLYLVRRVGFRRALGVLRGYARAGRSEGASIYPAAQNLLLAARAHGLGACLTSWHLFAEDEFKEVAGIPKDVKTWAVVPIGWPLRRFGPVRRRPVDEAIHHERW